MAMVLLVEEINTLRVLIGWGGHRPALGLQGELKKWGAHAARMTVLPRPHFFVLRLCGGGCGPDSGGWRELEGP